MRQYTTESKFPYHWRPINLLGMKIDKNEISYIQ